MNKLTEITRPEIEDFLFLEAELLDTWQLLAWRELFTPECAYIVPNLALPADGIYATWATRHETGEALPSVASVGTRPTFEDDARLVEVFILDFDADLYGETITTHFVKFLRPQIRFEGIEPLIKQMDTDTAAARDVLAGSVAPDA